MPRLRWWERPGARRRGRQLQRYLDSLVGGEIVKLKKRKYLLAKPLTVRGARYVTLDFGGSTFFFERDKNDGPAIDIEPWPSDDTFDKEAS